MGFDKQNVNRGRCTEPGCDCEDYKRTGDGSRCSTCRHVAVKHVAKHTGATGSHKAATHLPVHHSEDHDVKECYRCSSQYSFSKHGACITCHPRDQCSNPKCTELAYYDKDLGSFNYCSRECRDERELKGVNEQLRRALKEFEVVPGLEISSRAPKGRSSDEKVHGHGVENRFIVRGVTINIIGTSPYASSRGNPSTPRSTSSTGSNQSTFPMTSNMSVGSASQPTTSTGITMSQSDTKSTIPANPPVVVSHQSTQTCTSQPQSLDQNLPCFTALSVPASIFSLSLSNITFYDSMKKMDICGTTGILVSAIKLEEKMCGLELFDLVTHIDKKTINDMIGYDGRVCRTRIATRGNIWLTVQRVYHIPPVEELKKSFFGGGHVPRTCTSVLAAVSSTSKDLEECDTFLGVSMEGGVGYGSKKICRVVYGSAGWYIGLNILYTIASVAMVTTGRTLIGPERNWSFEYIKSTAKENSGICALLLLLQKQ